MCWSTIGQKGMRRRRWRDLWECSQNKGSVPFGAEPFTLDSAMVALHAHGGECTCTGLPSAVSQPTRGDFPGVGLPLRSLPSALVMKWSLNTRPVSKGDLISRVADLEKRHPSVSRHAIHGNEQVSPAKIGKARDDIVKAARTASQLFQNRFFYGQHGIRPPIDVRDIGYSTG